MILDTSFLIDVLRGEKEVREWEERLDNGGEEPIITSISVMEIWEGVIRSGNTEELKKIENLLEGLSSIEFDSEDGKTSGEILASLANKGNPIDVEDVMIGAIALNSNQKILTKNPDHFERIDNLKVKSY